MHWFDYSTIRYLPDPKRGEMINIGVVVYRNSGVDVRLLTNTSKIRMFDGDTTSNELFKLKHSISNLCSNSDEPDIQFNLLKNLGSGVFVTEKSSFSIENLSAYEMRVQGLFNSMVRPFSSREPRPNQSRFFTTIKNEFKKFEILANDTTDIDNHKIVPHFLIDKDSGLQADFMLKNGKYHMSELIDFNVNDMQAKFKETSLKTMTFITGKRVLQESMGCYFVYSASASKDKEIVSHLSLAEPNCDRLFNLYSKSEKASYYQLLADLTGSSLPL
jgi:hypothetical protein